MPLFTKDHTKGCREVDEIVFTHFLVTPFDMQGPPNVLQMQPIKTDGNNFYRTTKGHGNSENRRTEKVGADPHL